QRLRQQAMFVGTSATLLILWGLWVAIFYFLRARDYRRRLEAANRQLSSLNDELHEQATHDFLTGTHNRRAFNALLSNELERVKRYGGDLSLGVIDIDHFKQINDSRGHAVGDQALKFLVDNISQRMRRSDVLARLGGEEFVLLMPNTSVDEAVRVIDRMREAISALPLPGHEPELRFTFSAGVAGWRPGVSDRALLNAADEALYAAKGSGRDRVLGSDR
ncbi:MAG TPA: GGDEF domain-containing protein, partial [Rhodocyclaceae bacterium]|nr:GGDEF domain-containing protein [Rhodocyclaceae bacterium]